MVLKGKKRDIIIKLGILCFIIFLNFIFMMQSDSNIFSGNIFLERDSSVFKTIALLMKRGYMPYRDSFDHKGPLLYIYNWLGICISYDYGIWIVECISLFCTFILLYKIARLCCNRFYSCIVLIVSTSLLYDYFEGGNFTEEYALPFIAVSLFIFIDYFLNLNISKVRLLVCGISFGAVCMLRINMISAWIIFCIAVLVRCLKSKSYKDLRGFIFYFGLGVIAVILPMVIWLIYQEAFTDFIKDYFIFNSMYVADKSRATLVNKISSLLHFLNRTLILISCMLIAVNIRKKGKTTFGFTYLTYIFTTLIMICLSGMKFEHYGMILVPAIVYPLAQLIGMASRELKRETTVAGLILVYLSAVALPAWIRGIDRTILCFSGYEQENENFNNINEIINVVMDNTTEDDKITVWGNCDIIYAQTQRLPASRYSYQFPISSVDENILTEYFIDLDINEPKLIIVTKGQEVESINTYIKKKGYELFTSYGETDIYKKGIL